MKIAVTDANIFIDLFHIRSEKLLFKINYEIITTDKVIEELDSQHKDILYDLMQNGLLTVEVISPEDFSKMRELRIHGGLSESDLSVICIAEKYNILVLSGDDLVRKTCHKNKIDIHGILWCLNQFVEFNLINKTQACELLKALMKRNKRLPVSSCKEYIENKWEGSFEN